MGKDSHALITGLFMVTLITGIVIIIIWLGDVQQQTKTYVAETRDSVTGLKVGSTVYYRGIAVGKVTAVRFAPDNPNLIIVPMEIDNAVRFSRGVYATLELQGVTGLTQIALKDSGDNPEPLLNSDRPEENIIPIKPSLIDRLSVSGEGTVNETHELLLRLNRLLNENNVRHAERILINVESATGRFNVLQDEAGKALAQVPSLTADARRTLAEVNGLTGEFKQLSSQMRQELTALSKQSGELMQTGTFVGRQLLQTTLPRANTLMLQIQAATRRFDRVATMLETEPQAFLLGAEPLPYAPGEPGFKESP
jgi:phospholipid/cholesterol/gamma-HCH transport system substrate-binding protein